MRSAQGQGTVEYHAVVLLVALVAGGGTAVAARGDGPGIATAVPRQLIRALCIVRGGDCDRDRAACPVRSQTTRAGATVTIAFVRLGRHHVLLREERSDGTVALTLVEEGSGGVDVGTGARAALRLGRSRVAVGGEVRAAALIRTGSGSTWITRGAAAQALERRLLTHFAAAPAKDLVPGFLARRVLPALPPPAETFGDRGVELTGGATLSRGGGSLVAGVTAADVAGVRVDRSTGRRTLYLRGGAGVDASASIGSAGAAGSGGTDTEYALTIDRDGRPIDLAVVATGALGASVDVPPRLQPIAGMLDVPTGGRRAWVVERHLDLTEGDSLAVAGELLAVLRAARPRLGAPVRVRPGLQRRLDEHAVIDARTYTLAGSEYGGDLDARVGGVGAGVDVAAGTESAQLVAAMTRGIDGQWRRRDDCLKEART
ncbi:MAG: hypothetical protein QOF04_1549 [Solirubrobacteraceae bacterium]|nr:hypothetical protein [Solirubrobacteraceae bacterium]